MEESVAAKTTVEGLQAAAEAAQAYIATLEAQASEATVRVESLEALVASSETKIAELEAANNMEPSTESTETAYAVGTPEADAAESVHNLLANIEALTADELSTDLDLIINDEMSDAEKIAALKAYNEELKAYIDDIHSALEQVTANETELAQSVSSIEQMQAALVEAQKNVETLNADIAACNATIATLESKLAEQTTASAEMEALKNQLSDELTRKEELQAQLETAKTELETRIAQLEAENAKLQGRISELEAYQLSRTLGNGEAYVASTLADMITVAADGVTASWTFSNDTISGNAIELVILMGEEELYRSEMLQPGESISEFVLVRALEAGEYEAIAKTSVYDENGEFVSATRVPVGIKVGE